MNKIYMVCGLPACGKSYYAKKLAEELCILFIDDPKNFEMDIAVNLNPHSDLIIADPHFCRKIVRDTAMKRIEAINPDVIFHWIFFENDMEKCLNNMRKRMREGDDRKVENTIRSYSQLYTIPEGYEVRKIWQENQ